jgi:hypothetical protein
MSTQTAPFQSVQPSLRFKKPKKKLEKKRMNAVVRRAEEWLRDAMDYRDGDLQMTERWRGNRAWYFSTGRDRGALGNSTTYVNLIKEKTKKKAADETEADPTFNFRAVRPEGVTMAEHLNLSVPGVWIENQGRRKYRNTALGKDIYGSWFWSVDHVPATETTPVKIRIREVPPYRMFPAPHATDVMSAHHLTEVQPRTVEEIFSDFGIRVPAEFEPEMDFPDISEDLDGAKGSPVVWGPNAGTSLVNGEPTVTGGSVALFPSQMPESVRTEGMAFQKSMWIWDDAEEARYWIEMEKEGGPVAKHSMQRTFPKGRLIIWANGVKLFDAPAPYMRPYAHFRDDPFPEFFWGMSEIPDLINLQLLHDNTIDDMRLIHAFMSHPKMVIDKTTGLRKGTLINEPGQNLWTERGTQDRVNILPGVTPPAEFYTHTSAVERWVDLLTGSFDVTRGVNPSGVTAARAVVALQRAAGIRVRARMKETEDSLSEVGRMIAERIQDFGLSHSQLPDADGKGFREFLLSEDDRTSPFNLKVDVISNLEDLRALEFQKLLLLHGMGLVGDERLIKDSGISSVQTLLAELPEVRLQRQIQALAAAGMEGGAAGAAQQTGGAQRAISRGLRTNMGDSG